MGFTKASGRAAFGGYFVFNGIHHCRELKNLKVEAAAKNVDYPELAVQASRVLLIASGLSLGLGIKPRAGAAGIAMFLGATAVKIHNYWDQSDPGRWSGELASFSKNLALIAATVAIGADDATGKCCSVEPS